MTSKLVVNTIEADTGISSVSFASSISLSSTSKFHFSAAGIDIDADTNINRPAAGVIGFNINSSEKVRINSSGQLGIGTVTPISALDVRGTTHALGNGGAALVWGNTTSLGTLSYSGTDAVVTATNNLSLMTAGTERIKIQSDGTKVISNGRLNITSTFIDFSGSISTPSTAAAIFRPADNTLAFSTANTERLRIDAAGNLRLGGSANASTNYGRNFQIHDTGTSGATLHLTTSQTGSSNSDGFHLVQQGSHLYHWLRESGDQVFATAATERVRILSDGKVRLSNSSGVMLDLRTSASTGSCWMQLSDSAGNQKGYFGYGSGSNETLYIVQQESANIDFYTGSSTRMALTPTGNLKISDPGITFSDSSPFFPVAWSGTDGYNTTFTIASTGYANLRFRGEQTSGTEYTMGVGAGIFYMAYDDINNGHRITVAANGVVSLNVNDTSDEKMKKNITSLADGAISRIKQLRPVNFDWKKDSDLNGQSGFIAQEIKTVIPDLVQGEEYVEGSIESVGYSVNTTGIVAHLTKALQEAITKIETLETKVAALEGS